MKSEDFKISPTGRVVRTLDGHPAFIPNPLPPEFETGRIINLLAKAQQQLGALSEVGRSLPNPYLFFRPMMSQEAVSSSAMEGTVTTLTNLFAYEAAARGSAADVETREVHNYVRALQYAADTLNKLPISKRLLCNTHEVLMARVSRVRGRQKRPGEFRGPGDNAWTGPTERIEDARFVFVPGEQVLEAFGALEQYIADIEKLDDLPVLVKVALIHYQFETIHPFFDGNGRLGRLMIPLLLYQLRMLPHPMLYLSAYFQRNKDSYIDCLYKVSRSAEWEQWINFFLKGVASQAGDTIIRFHSLQALQHDYKERLSRPRASTNLLQLVDMIFESPIVTIPEVAKKLDVSYNAAKQNVQRLLDEEILAPLDFESRAKFFFAIGVYRLISEPIDGIEDKSREASAVAK